MQTDKHFHKVLPDSPCLKKLKIIEIYGGSQMRQFLGRLGLGIGSEIRILRYAPFSGPVLIEHKGIKTAIGRGMAANIEIEVME